VFRLRAFLDQNIQMKGLTEVQRMTIRNQLAKAQYDNRLYQKNQWRNKKSYRVLIPKAH
jgi:hypothetical protein